uniref:Uncharacterized protein n=1 Tax=Candidatus Kentrum sp. FM TaxID=2126340 RepID=A0A450RU71_9GAMM|nr:MAG: hypothetical protein BECKFM1743A_GA0114220_100017 [Candidatus Kentron sp. FM]VFJ43330.1 MAG: hypothetical protein BECKFM1743C_GA0114222_100017 [Candidatus Kentron sp. FM]VFK05494.1 MAG: hypothetical protein BECKFM1743B_GA0114221_100017 [Candidatus Kentron sp. FM]
MDPLNLTPPGMVGWFPELDAGHPLILERPNELRVKIVVTSRGITVQTLAGEAIIAKELLIHLGFRPEQIRELLCG